MALRSVMHSHPCRNFLPMMVTALDSLSILPHLAKDLNLRPDSALAIPRHPADLSFFDQAVSVRGRDSVMARAVPAVYRASLSSADSSDSRDSVPGFADSVVADYSSPAPDLAFVGPGFDPGFVAVRLVTVAVVVAAAARLSFDPSCSVDFSGAVAAVASDVASVSQSSSSRSPTVPPRPYLVGPASMPARNVARHFPSPSASPRSFSRNQRGPPRSCRDCNGSSPAASAIDRPATG